MVRFTKSASEADKIFLAILNEACIAPHASDADLVKVGRVHEVRVRVV